MKIMIYGQELLSVVLTPFVLWFSLPDCAPAIVDFFREFTIHVDSLGYVCSFAVFDFQRHGNVKVSLDLCLVPFSSICSHCSRFLSFRSLPQDLCSGWIFWGTRGTVLMDCMAHGISLAPEKLFFAEFFLSRLVWRADDGK